MYVYIYVCMYVLIYVIIDIFILYMFIYCVNIYIYNIVYTYIYSICGLFDFSAWQAASIKEKQAVAGTADEALGQSINERLKHGDGLSNDLPS